MLAATNTATFDVTITIQDECQITAASDLDFGSHGVLSSDVSGTTTVSVQCTNTTGYDIGLDEGDGVGATVGVRKMTGPGGITINYSLYEDVGHSDVWGNTISTDTVSGVGNGGAQNYTVYGLVPAQATPLPGTFTDIITVTVTF